MQTTEAVCAARFNLLNNWQRFEEPIDIWMMRYSIEAKVMCPPINVYAGIYTSADSRKRQAGYWGVNNIRRNETIAIIDAVKVSFTFHNYISRQRSLRRCCQSRHQCICLLPH